LNGDRDGVPKDKTYVFKLYLAIQDYKLAADTALEIANSEQSSGRYKQSHDLLFKCYKALQKAGVKIPHSLYKMLALVHSYILVKPLIKMDDHEKGSRMLIRVANSISHFPMRKLFAVHL
jgi:WD repeat-containing protein 19